MSTKNKTISFRIRKEKFDRLRTIADERELSLSTVFRDYVATFTTHQGDIEVIPKSGLKESTTDGSQEYPPTIVVEKDRIREHERLELECEHLREQLQDLKQYGSALEQSIEEQRGEKERLVRLEDVDFEAGTSVKVE